MVQDGPQWYKIVQMVHICPKLSIMVQNCPNGPDWIKTVQNGPNGP